MKEIQDVHKCFDIDGNVVALGHGLILIRGMDYDVGSPINVVLKAFHPLELSLVVLR